MPDVARLENGRFESKGFSSDVTTGLRQRPRKWGFLTQFSASKSGISTKTRVFAIRAARKPRSPIIRDSKSLTPYRDA